MPTTPDLLNVFADASCTAHTLFAHSMQSLDLWPSLLSPHVGSTPGKLRVPKDHHFNHHLTSLVLSSGHTHDKGLAVRPGSKPLGPVWGRLGSEVTCVCL